MTRSTASSLVVLVLALTPACGATKFVGVSGDDGGDDGAASGDAGDGAADGGAREGGSLCAKLTFSEACQQDGDCGFVLHQVDCCGTKQWVGVNAAFQTEAQNAERALEGTCGKCGCPAQQTTTQDGQVALESTKVTVHCSSHTCRTTTN